MFNSRIGPYLVNTVLPKKNPEIANKLKKIKLQDGSFITLPYIQLYEKDSIKLAKRLLIESRSNIKDDKFICWLKNDLEKIIKNKPTFAIRGIESLQTIIPCISDYESTISTSDKHYYNLIRYFPLKAKRGEYFSYRNNRYTKEWINSLNKIILKKSFNHYHASIGCSVLTVLKSSDKKYKYLISESSEKKGSASIERHVTPSSMFQPVSSTLNEQERELDFKINILREYGEEILGLEELEHVDIADTLFNYLDTNPLLKRLQEGLTTGQAKLIQTGMCLDIFRLRPEMTFVLILHDEIYAKNIKRSWESKSIVFYDINNTEEYYELISDKKKPLCPPGLAALVNGREEALKHIEK